MPTLIKLESGRFRLAKDRDNWLCPCTLGHTYAFEAEHCAKVQERLHNPELKAQEKCYGCKYYDKALENTKFTRHLRGRTDVFHGLVFREFCKREELQSEADNYNEEYAERSEAETICADEDYQYFEAKTGDM